MQLSDSFGRKFYYLRLSITDVCNFKCEYCLPNGYQHDKKNCFLSLDEIRRTVAAFASVGTEKIRITGGEPALRKDLTQIIAMISEIAPIKKIAMTTNGYNLAKNAQQWYDAGLNQINISVDSLNPNSFNKITGVNRFDQVMKGIDKALSVGFDKIKINSVLIKNFNDHELGLFLEFIRIRPIEMRFIELMECGDTNTFFEQYHSSGDLIKRQLEGSGWQLEEKAKDDGPALVYSHPGYLGKIGLIMPYSKDFCTTCNRLRVSSLGKMHLCLFGDYGTDIRHLLQRDDQQSQLVSLLHDSVATKEVSHYLHQGNTGQTPHLASIGG
ncbi:MAG: GTP 3',8-cyclase MoaA [Gammaproteobacteria bacterium]|nr:GTP 3',8-cyclase MoaA [Gammaproteobacteria bacterium]